MGSIYQRGAVYWIKYYRNGVAIRESSESEKESVAKQLLRQREGDIARGVPVTPQTNRCKIDELFQDVLNDYKVNGKRSMDNVVGYVDNHLLPFFRGWKAAAITTADVRKYVLRRQGAQAANATINRELAALKRAFSLGIDAGKVTGRPKITMLKEAPPRRGFFEREQFQTVRSRLPEALQPVVTFLYITGWRVDSEVLPLTWRQVDLEAGTVRLDPGTTKNDEGRVFPMIPELRSVLDQQRIYTDAVQRERSIICPYVFHRDGKRIRDFRGAWKSACKAAGVPGMIRHDFRRTAVRNLVRASVPEAIAMKLTGHKTRSVFERYNIVSEADLFEAASKLAKLTGTVSGTNALDLRAQHD